MEGGGSVLCVCVCVCVCTRARAQKAVLILSDYIGEKGDK